MGYLVGITVLWAFSFSLIGAYLAGQVDSYFSVMTRIVLAALLFLPLLRPHLLRGRQRLMLMGLGAVQLGVMYIFFYQSFLLLSVPEVLLFTVLTPLYITLLDARLFKRVSPFHLLTAAMAVLAPSSCAGSATGRMANRSSCGDPGWAAKRSTMAASSSASG